MKKLLVQPVFWIVLVSLLPLWTLLTPGLPVTHDGQDHVARIANFYQSLTEGNLVPRWAAHLNWGYGHPILMFLYPLPSYLASGLHLAGFSLINSTKLIFAGSFVASLFTMYIFMSKAFGKRAGFVGALLYGFAPYRFVDLYVRGALGEHVAFIFPPLILYFIYRLSRVRRWKDSIWFTVGATISFAGLILAHNAIAIMFLPIIALYGIYLTFKSLNKWIYIVSCKLSGLMGFGLSAFFWIPALFEGKYTLRDIVTAGESLQRFVPVPMFFYSPWNYGGTDNLTKSMGLAQWLGVIGALFVIWKTKKRETRFILIGTLIIFAVSLFIMTSLSESIWRAVTFLQKFQFPWRFLSVSVFSAAVLGGIAVSELLQKKKIGNLLFTLFCALTIVLTIFMWQPKAYLMKNESFFTGTYSSTTDTGESSPIWSVRFMERAPESPIQVISGTATAVPVFRNTTVHEYRVLVQSPARLVENTLYFPGWKIYIDGVAADMQFQDPDYRGLMTFRITEGDHVVRVAFGETRLRKFANMISLVSFSALISFCVSGLLWKKRTYR